MSTFKKYYDDVDYKRRHIEHQKEKFTCPDCGAIVNRSSYWNHQQSARHKKNMRENSEILTELEKKRASVVREYDKKIRAVERKRAIEIQSVQKRLDIFNV